MRTVVLALPFTTTREDYVGTISVSLSAKDIDFLRIFFSLVRHRLLLLSLLLLLPCNFRSHFFRFRFHWSHLFRRVVIRLYFPKAICFSQCLVIIICSWCLHNEPVLPISMEFQRRKNNETNERKYMEKAQVVEVHCALAMNVGRKRFIRTEKKYGKRLFWSQWILAYFCVYSSYPRVGSEHELRSEKKTNSQQMWF